MIWLFDLVCYCVTVLLCYLLLHKTDRIWPEWCWQCWPCIQYTTPTPQSLPRSGSLWLSLWTPRQTSHWQSWRSEYSQHSPLIRWSYLESSDTPARWVWCCSWVCAVSWSMIGWLVTHQHYFTCSWSVYAGTELLQCVPLLIFCVVQHSSGAKKHLIGQMITNLIIDMIGQLPDWWLSCRLQGQEPITTTQWSVTINLLSGLVLKLIWTCVSNFTTFTHIHHHLVNPPELCLYVCSYLSPVSISRIRFQFVHLSWIDLLMSKVSFILPLDDWTSCWVTRTMTETMWEQGEEWNQSDSCRAEDGESRSQWSYWNDCRGQQRSNWSKQDNQEVVETEEQVFQQFSSYDNWRI